MVAGQPVRVQSPARKTFGKPDIDSNYYNGALYSVGHYFRDDIVDMKDQKFAGAVVFESKGFKTDTMTFDAAAGSKPISGSTFLASKHYQQYWSSADHDGSPRSDGRHGPKHVADRRVGRYDCHRFARPHDLMNAHQRAATNHAARMKFSKILLIESARLQKDHGQSVAQREHHRGT